MNARSGKGDRPFRPKVISGPGDRDHARGAMGWELLVAATCDKFESYGDQRFSGTLRPARFRELEKARWLMREQGIQAFVVTTDGDHDRSTFPTNLVRDVTLDVMYPTSSWVADLT
ncbi:MAG TPA: hypothetical protein VNZ53_22140 [Steroidobacteraceae bacterium]|jgi:hypothetical protein|nr:hypothetical protein [Steroidobacteraceae bacterium]